VERCRSSPSSPSSSIEFQIPNSFFSPVHPSSIPSDIMVLTESFPCMILHRRNLACRGCGCPRSENQVSRQPPSGLPAARFPSSPRFVGSATATSSYSPPLIPHTTSPSHYPTPSHSPRQMSASQPGLISVKPPSPSHPLLTPSGRSFAVGGKVQNVSSDPLAPCVLYWPDNEPFPEQGQIRPNHLTGIPVRRPCFVRPAHSPVTLATPHSQHGQPGSHRAPAG